METKLILKLVVIDVTDKVKCRAIFDTDEAHVNMPRIFEKHLFGHLMWMMSLSQP